MRIGCVGYREWALEIYDRLAQTNDHEFMIWRSKNDFSEKEIRKYEPDIVLFYGWSWFINESIINDFCCLMLHPSPLPLYRGGSPIQNQIIDGELKSKVTIFIMNNEMDSGDIVAQTDLSLGGSLNEIFSKITDKGEMLTRDILINGINPIAQDHSKATYCKRRKPEDSEITIDELKNCSAEYLYNKIRMLADPYPNAFIKTKDNKKLFLNNSYIGNE